MSHARLFAVAALAATLLLTSCTVSRRTTCGERSHTDRTLSSDDGADEGTNEGTAPKLSPPGRHPGLYTVFKNNSNNLNVMTEQRIGYLVSSSAEPGVEYWIMTIGEEGPPALDTAGEWLHLELTELGDHTYQDVCGDEALMMHLMGPLVYRIEMTLDPDAFPCDPMPTD